MSRLSVRDICKIGIMSTILIIFKLVVDFLPNIEFVTFFLILFTMTYGIKTIYTAITFCFISGFIYGFGDWVVVYFIIFPSIVLLTYSLRKMLVKSNIVRSIYSAMLGLFFSFAFVLEWIILYGLTSGIGYYINGIPFDIYHMIGNYTIMIILGNKVYEVLNRLLNNLEE